MAFNIGNLFGKSSKEEAQNVKNPREVLTVESFNTSDPETREEMSKLARYLVVNTFDTVEAQHNASKSSTVEHVKAKPDVRVIGVYGNGMVTCAVNVTYKFTKEEKSSKDMYYLVDTKNRKIIDPDKSLGIWINDVVRTGNAPFETIGLNISSIGPLYKNNYLAVELNNGEQFFLDLNTEKLVTDNPDLTEVPLLD